MARMMIAGSVQGARGLHLPGCGYGGNYLVRKILPEVQNAVKGVAEWPVTNHSKDPQAPGLEAVLMISGTPHKKKISQVPERDRWINWRRVHHIKNMILDGNITTTGQIYRLKGIISFLSYEKKQVLWVACKTAGYPQHQLYFLFEGWAPDGVTA